MHAAMNRLEALGGITRRCQVNADVLSRFQASLRQEGSRETTIRSYLKHLHASLAWAEELGLIPQVPKCALPKGATTSQMKGRPITPEEFARMLAATRQMNRLHDRAHWRRYLRALWLSGLRLAESLRLSWQEGEPFAVDLTGRHPLFRIRAGAQKSRRNELLPMTPDLAQWLLATPDSQRRGPVFPLIGRRGGPLDADGVGGVVSRIGRAAGVVVDPARGKYASAHDLRRAFGTRWAKRVKPVTLQKLMRHRNLKTTLDFYVHLDADEIADELWAAQRAGGHSVGHAPAETAARLGG